MTLTIFMDTKMHLNTTGFSENTAGKAIIYKDEVLETLFHENKEIYFTWIDSQER